jgi:hypothetical protein
MSRTKAKAKPISSPLDDIGASITSQPKMSRAGKDFAAGKSKVLKPRQPPALPSTPRAEGRSWDDTHKPETFYCPLDVRERLTAAMQSSGRSKSRVIVDALCQHLGIERPQAR